MSILTPNRRPISRYQPPARELPPRWNPPAMWERHPRSPLWQFVFLSMLLHALGILLFGAPSGGSREGRALWGSLDVVIRDSFRGPALRFDRELASLPTPAAKVEPNAEPPRVTPPPPREAPVPATIPPVLDRLERSLETPAFEVPRPAEMAEPRIEAPPAPAPVEPPPRPIVVPRIELPVAPRIERQLAEPRIDVPPPKPVEVPRLEAPAMPRVERQMAEPPKIDAPVVQPRIEVPALQPRIEAPLVQPMQAPVLRAPQVETLSTPRVEAPPAPPAPAAPPAAPVPPAAPEAATKVAPQLDRGPAAPPSPARIEAAPAPSPFRGAPLPKPDTPYDPTAPALDLDALRKRAGELTRAGTGNRAALPFPMPPVEKPKTKMEDAIEKARKPDCRTAYQSLGLAAIVPLIANEFGEGHCRW